MPGVFISHAFADKSLVDEFVDTVVKLGCGLKSDQIFYSSGEDTGIPSGYDLLRHVRNEVGEAGLVIAIVSPAFQARPVCIAELGAAWSRVDNLFPLAVPGMDRTDMEGVLQGMVVRYLDDSAALAIARRTPRSCRGSGGQATQGHHMGQVQSEVAGERLAARKGPPRCKDGHAR
ncbi:MAG: toll/interleukin-1 receptor domain-containing protein [Acidimicrobiales bacterium]